LAGFKDEAGSWIGDCQICGWISSVLLKPVGTLRRICVKVREPIELPFGVVSGVGPGIGVLDGLHIPKEKGIGFGGFF